MQYNIMHSLHPERGEMNIEYQLQIDAIKGTRLHYREYENLIFICDGYIGVYLNERELKIDKTKMIRIEATAATNFNPENLLRERTAAIETKTARRLPGSGYAIKIYSKETGEHCYVDAKYLKMFKDYNSLFIKSKRDPVLIYRYGVPYGIILPMNIPEQEGES